MPTIELLKQETIDKIAAGEVVEKPANVVKELVENAIDSGAKAITVEIQDGGIKLIRVTDNGCGIEKDQIQKAFLRHATSKIEKISDLEHLVSLGFRGEALSSIAAVSMVEVITKTKDSLTGLRYVIEGGVEGDKEEIGAPQGTTILVRNIFYNTPARRKFLKTAQTEGAYISDLLEHLALSRPEISIKFINNGQTRFHTSGKGDLKEIIYKVYGREQAMALLPVDFEENSIKIWGFVGKPETTKANRSQEIFFVNGRYIKSTMLSTALEDGCKFFLMQHRFPFAVLNIQVDSQNMDINIHPAKMEVKFSEEIMVSQSLSKAVSGCFARKELIRTIPLSKEEAPETKAEAIRTPEPFEVRRRVAEDTEYKILGSQSDNTREAFLEAASSNVIKADQQIIIEKPNQLNLFEEHFLSREKFENYHILGQIFKTYWLIELEDTLYFMDQHAAHEKVQFERFMKHLANDAIVSQALNPPVILQLTPIEEDVLNVYMDVFEKMGFQIDDFGPSSYAVREVPVDLYGLSEQEYLQEILNHLEKNRNSQTLDGIYDRIATMACKAAVKGNNELSLEEVKALLQELMELDNPYNCPHGRPTLIAMTEYEIKKKFSRIV